MYFYNFKYFQIFEIPNCKNSQVHFIMYSFSLAFSPKRILKVNGLNSRPTLFITPPLEAGDNLREEMLRWCFMHQEANRIDDNVYKDFGAHGLVVLRGVMLIDIVGRIILTWAPVDQELFFGKLYP